MKLFFQLTIKTLAKGFVLLGLSLVSAAAEPVRVSSATGSAAQGWLFGDPTDGTCWLALPEHAARGVEAQGVTFRTATGLSGETDPVVPVARNAAALEATGGQTDLAFAPVRSSGISCLSGLGLPGYAYQSALRGRPRLTLTDNLSPSLRPFDVRVTQITVDEIAGRVIAIWPERPEDDPNMVEGISGGVATLAYGGSEQPFAMVFRVNRDKQIGASLRFDAIRAAFNPIRSLWLRTERDSVVARGGLDFDIAGFKGIALAGSGPSQLREPEGCWRAAAKGGARTVDLIIETQSAFDHVEALEVVAADDCSPAPEQVYVEYRTSPEESWRTIATCAVIQPIAPCRIDKGGKLQIRLKIPTNRGEMALSHLRMIGDVRSE